MRLATILAAAALLAPVSAFAQADKKAPAPPATCEALATELGFVEKTAETTIEDLADGCRLTSFFINFGQHTRYRIGQATLTAPGLLAAYAGQSLPTELDLAITGFLISPDTGSALTNYIIEMQSEPMDIHLAYRWDPTAHTVDLADFSVAAQAYGAFRVSGRFSDIDLDPARMAELASMPGAIDQLRLEIDNARFFSTLFAPAAVGLLPYDQDPRPLIEGYKQAAASFIANLPATNVPDDAKAALTTFVTDFPKPTGDYALELQADPPIQITALATDSLPAAVALFARLQVTASHAPASP